MKRTLPLVLTMVIGLFMVGEWFVPHYQYRIVTDYIQEFGTILAAAAFLLGMINLLQVNIPIIRDRKEDWGFKLVMLLAMVVTMFLGLAAGTNRQSTDVSAETWVDSGLLGLLFHGAVPLGENGEPVILFQWIFTHMFDALNATMFALLAFYVASAAFRAFRARNFEASLLLGAAILIMFLRAPLGEKIAGDLLSNPDIGSNIVGWIMNVPNVAARRAIFIGAALGAIATGLRVILGVERSHLGGD